MTKLSEYYENQMRKLVIEIINNRDTDILSNITIVDDIQLKEHSNKGWADQNSIGI